MLSLHEMKCKKVWIKSLPITKLKSWQVATAMEAKKKLGQVKHGVVVAKASLVYNWRDEIHMHTNERAVVVAGNRSNRDKIYSQLTMSDDWTFMVMSYETFREDIANLQLLDNTRPLDFCVLLSFSTIYQ